MSFADADADADPNADPDPNTDPDPDSASDEGADSDTDPDPDSREYIHRSVAQLMFPIEAFQKCWALENHREPDWHNGRRFWYPLPRQDHQPQSWWRRYLPWSLAGNVSQQRQGRRRRRVFEATYFDVEGMLTILWATRAHHVLQDNAQETDDDPFTLLAWVHENFPVGEEFFQA